jgi:hypothetical protein
VPATLDELAFVDFGDATGPTQEDDDDEVDDDAEDDAIEDDANEEIDASEDVDPTDDHGQEELVSASQPPPQGSPPKSRITSTPKSATKSRTPTTSQEPTLKKLKLVNDRKRTPTVVEGMVSSLKEQAEATTEASRNIADCRKAELEYKKEQDKAELDVKTRVIVLQEREFELKQRLQNREAFLQEARLMHDIGFSKEEICDFMRGVAP